MAGAETEHVVVVGDESSENLVSSVQDLILKLRSRHGSRLSIVVLGRGVQTVIPRLREVLLSNLNVGVRLYIVQSLDELSSILARIARDEGPITRVVLASSIPEIRQVVINFTSTYRVSEVSIC